MKKKVCLLLIVFILATASVYADSGWVKWDYDMYTSFDNGLAQVGVQDGDVLKIGLINSSGKLVTPIKYSEIQDFHEGVALVSVGKGRDNYKYGLIDTKGKELTKMKYDYIGYQSDTLFPSQIGDKWGCLDKTGKEVIPFKYDDMYYYSGGVIFAELNGKYGALDKEGKVVIPFIYDFYEGTSNNLAGVKLNYKSGGIDVRDGKTVIPFIYDDITMPMSGDEIMLGRIHETGWQTKIIKNPLVKGAK